MCVCLFIKLLNGNYACSNSELCVLFFDDAKVQTFFLCFKVFFQKNTTFAKYLKSKFRYENVKKSIVRFFNYDVCFCV